MGYYNYLCELLRPLRVYRLDEGSLSGAERWRRRRVRVC